MLVRVLLLAIAACAIAACAGPATPPPPTASAPEPEPPPPPPAEPAPPPALLADGAPCTDAAACASGVCEGEGCDADHPGTCAPRERGCTRDLRSYCGCDGQTFRAAGSCPGRRFRARGACAP